MTSAAEALSGAVEDIEGFLTGEDYEFTKVICGDKITIILKLEDGNSMAILYEDDEFNALESSFEKDGKQGYKDIMNDYIKETIKNGAGANIVRHKGSKVVAK
jgi:hypothetical protein